MTPEERLFFDNCLLGEIANLEAKKRAAEEPEPHLFVMPGPIGEDWDMMQNPIYSATKRLLEQTASRLLAELESFRGMGYADEELMLIRHPDDYCEYRPRVDEVVNPRLPVPISPYPCLA